MRHLHSVYICIALFVLSALSSSPVATQSTGTVAGRVVNDTGAPLPSANVVLPGLERGTTTGADGRFRLFEVPTGAQALWYIPATDTVTDEDGRGGSLPKNMLKPKGGNAILIELVAWNAFTNRKNGVHCRSDHPVRFPPPPRGALHRTMTDIFAHYGDEKTYPKTTSFVHSSGRRAGR